MSDKIKRNSELIGEYMGIKIYGKSKPAKTNKGRDVIYILLTQERKKHQWEVDATLSYPHNVHVRFRKKN